MRFATHKNFGPYSLGRARFQTTWTLGYVFIYRTDHGVFLGVVADFSYNHDPVNLLFLLSVAGYVLGSVPIEE
jgi:hypothetical protein